MKPNRQLLIRKIRYRLVYNRSRRLNKRGEGLIQIECEQYGKKIYFSTRTYVRPDEWCDGQLVYNNGNADGLNYQLYRQLQDIERIELEFIKQGKNVTLAMMQEAVKSHFSPGALLCEFGTEVIEQSERKNLTKLNYKTLFNNLDKFRHGVRITEIDYPFIVAYDKWLRDSGVSHNTRISRLRLLRAVLNEAVKREMIFTNPFERFRIQQMVAKKGYVSAENLQRLERLDLDGKENLVRDAFLLACYTGLRYSDIISLRKEHVGEDWITKKMVKTGYIVEIPYREIFNGGAARLIDKYADIGKLTKEIGCNAEVNKTLKQIFERLDVDKKLTFHSSRHTFATLLAQAGLDINIIQRLLGHQKITTTQIYSETDKRTIERAISRKFHNFVAKTA